MTNTVAAVTDSVDAVVVELSGDALLHQALRFGSPGQTLQYAIEAVAVYSLAAGAMAGQPFARQQLLQHKLNSARALENWARSYLLGKGTEAALVQYVLANPGSSDATTYLSQIRGKTGQASGIIISSLVDVEQPPARGHDVAVIVTLARTVQENTQHLNRYVEMMRYHGHLSMEGHADYLRLLKETDRQLNVILPMYAQLQLEEPTAAAKVSALGQKLEELVQLQGQLAEALMRT